MGSSRTEEESRSQKAQERIKGYQYIIDAAYTLFEGKYSMHEIETMPYRELLIRIEKEQERLRELENEKIKHEEAERREAQRLESMQRRQILQY